ncbi:hypothetical protein N7451_007178 [Penicillium sp. IBT 35674x]|nr:hypothetical protein N7451_007178 [Penicillium sp. IBT 35674x]
MTYYKYYHYDPSLAGACIFCDFVRNIYHLAYIPHSQAQDSTLHPSIEFVGYTARAISSTEAPHLTLGPYVIQTLLLLVAPPLFAASIYMVLGRIILSVDAESYSLIKKRWLTKTFVISDVVCFLVQLAGAGLMASSHASMSKTGADIVLAGLWLQIVIFGFFVVLALIFERRLRAVPTRQSKDGLLPWKRFMCILYIACTFIMIRNIVRVAEFIEGFQGYIILHEVFLYVFDAVPMMLVMVIFSIWYPSVFLKRTGRTKLDERSQTPVLELSDVE